MTTVAISGLPVAAAINATDIIPFVQPGPPAAGTTKSITKTKLFDSPTIATPTMTGPILGTVTSGNISACTSTSMVMVTPVIGAATGTSLVLSGAATAATVAVSNVIGTTAVANTLGITAFVLPTPKAINFVGAGTIKTITVPTLFSTGGGEITLIPTAAFTWDATGNIAVAGTAVISRALTMTYDSFTAKFYPSYV